MTTATKLANRVGDFKYSSGCQTAQDFREAFQKLMEKHGEEGFKEMYWDHAEAICDERDIHICHYDYGNGGYGSCFVELTPSVWDEELSLNYDVYIETDGHLEEYDSIPVGKEDDVIKVFEEAMNKATEENAEHYKFYQGELCEHQEWGIATFVNYESCGDESVIRLAKDNSSDEYEELYVPSDSIRPYFA